ncbi:Adenylate and Guanylate cyclase catalytic domain containing protein [Tritrichomonas foetus]|uniref:Adenylate and Guanylate cyclase catalytic domain containing protein n=1 Tax=Tritrichomonas foetus TaxID=1144522 RepID=A0A1J4KKJ1_9EUKA|nr:Adenylate and Guanylate cyclase catalytic domain containing protein [Tritrichomonas foetus]|eukprot:OHT10214.1 Adenylate and Guanylate cyclase catalytic domain containing protein [Tritrichomonas foetus]
MTSEIIGNPGCITSSAASPLSSNSTHDEKYGGLIERPIRKQLRKDISNLFLYVFSVTPSFKALHLVVTIFRLLQMIGPSFCSRYSNFWSDDDLSYSTISLISAFFFLIPSKNRDDGFLIFMIIYILIVLFAVFVIIMSAKVFMKNATLPIVIPYFIQIYISTLGYLLHPIAIEMSVGEISRCLAGHKQEFSSVIVVSVLSLLVSIIYFWIFVMIASASLMFRPTSMATTLSKPQNYIFISQVIVTFLTALGEGLNEGFQGALLFVTSIIYFASIFIIFMKGGIISTYVSSFYAAVCEVGGVMCFVISLMLFLGKKGNMVLLIAMTLLYVIASIITYMLFSRYRLRNNILLDRINDNRDCLAEIKSVNQYVNVVVSGFIFAHPCCTEWTIFKLGIERWPQSPLVWAVYSKFIVIYPEEISTLEWICKMIRANNVKGRAAKIVRESAVLLVREREQNLSPDLKIKLNSLTKHLSSCKHKLRYVWDLAIQSNISDMEQATKKALAEIYKTEVELMHIMRTYPNNRFVTRNYARFCRELKADKKTAAEMNEKTRLLQRGIMVNRDQAREFGFDTFKNLPSKLKVSKESTLSLITSTTSTFDLDIEEENKEDEETNILGDQIKHMVIPSTRNTIIFNIIIFIFVFTIPAIGCTLLIGMFVSYITSSLSHLYYISTLRTNAFQLVLWNLESVYERLGIANRKINSTSEMPPISVGSTWETVKQLKFLAQETSTILQNVERFRGFAVGDLNIDNAQMLLFNNVINYTYYINNRPFSTNVSLVSAMADFITLQNVVVDTSMEINSSIMNSSSVLNGIVNLPTIAQALDYALSEFSQYAETNDKYYQNILGTSMKVICVLAIFVYSITLIGEIAAINNAKDQTYRCLTALPKNVVSQLTENLRVLKKDNEGSHSNINSELNKQEDNILKIFATGSSSSSIKAIDSILIIISSIIMMCMHIGCNITLCTLVKRMSVNLKTNSQHINYIQGAIAFTFGSELAVAAMVRHGNPEGGIQAVTKEKLVDYFRSWLKSSVGFYHRARFGGSPKGEYSFSGFANAIKEANLKRPCVDPNIISTTLLEATKCMSPDESFIMIHQLWSSRVEPYAISTNTSLYYDPYFDTIWSLLIFPLYDALFDPMTRSITNTLKDDLIAMESDVIPYLIIMIMVCFCMECILVIQTIRIEKHIKDVLKFLMNAPVKALLQNTKIMRVLSGDFRKNKLDNTTRNNTFFETIVEHLPDIVIVTNAEGIIESVNNSLSRIFDIQKEEIIGKSLKKYVSDISKEKDLIQLSLKDGTAVHLEATEILINTKQVLILRDMTQTVRYNTLINAEKAKNDKLLSSILPANLVERVKNGEKNISFAVQSATIVFMDIVSFTPWCGSLPADKVMMTLNNLFKKFDACASMYRTMTKIKCIGDCYMAAGGVFSEINQPSEHAKEVVNFGLDAIDSVLILNKEVNEKLEIRVGINTGGPIVAGVLGIGKPTFEILGPAINMAQQMEHHGVSMNVHVSRSVYELIYGGNFAIKERGNIELKDSIAVTYLITRK